MSEINCTDFDQYQELALRTLNVRGHIDNMLHAIMGMSGEAGEFAELPYEQRDKRIGEIGDCMWYCAVLSKELGFKFGAVIEQAQMIHKVGCDLSALSGEMRALLWSCRLIDVIKKTVFYGKDPDHAKLSQYLFNYVAALMGMAAKTQIQMLEAGSINIRKLAARYPDLKFDADRAINRNYKTESAAAGVEIA